MNGWSQQLNQFRQQTGKIQPGRIGRTLLEVAGRERLIIERHRGIQCYATEEIIVGASFGQIQICGSGLNLCCMSREQLCITGTIDSVTLLGRSCSGAVE